MAVSTASPPEVVKASRSFAVIAHAISLTSPRRSLWTPTAKPRPSCSRTASTTKSGEWPNRFVPKPSAVSMYSLPSTSQIRDPLERSGDDLVDELLPGRVEPDDRAVVGESRAPRLGEPLRPRRPGVGAAHERLDRGPLAVGQVAARGPVALVARREVVALGGHGRLGLGRLGGRGGLASAGLAAAVVARTAPMPPAPWPRPPAWLEPAMPRSAPAPRRA